MTGGAEINFGGAREVHLCEFERGTRAREVYSSLDQTNKVKTKKKKVSCSKIFTNSGYSLKILAIFHEFLSEDKKKGCRPKNFMKSVMSLKKLGKYRWQTLIWASICTPEALSLLISLGHSPSLGGHNFCLGGHKQ